MLDTQCIGSSVMDFEFRGRTFTLVGASAQAAKFPTLKTPRMRVTIQREISGPCTRKLTGISTQLPNVD